MKEYGGYFEAEELSETINVFPANAFITKSARASIGRILMVKKPTQVYLPYFCCNALLEPFELCKIPYHFYSINPRFELHDLPELQSGEMIVYVNYFGLKNNYSRMLCDRYRNQLILDNTQALFFELTKDEQVYTVNSFRKFFGVPDGSLLHVPDSDFELFNKIKFSANTRFTTEHLLLRKAGKTQEGYAHFGKNELMAGEGFDDISDYSRERISHIDYRNAAKARLQNFSYLHAQLKSLNTLQLPVDNHPVPFSYPYWPKHPIRHEQLWQKKIFAPILWRECLTRNEAGFETEKSLSLNVLHLPVDHRYSEKDMRHLVDTIARMADAESKQ